MIFVVLSTFHLIHRFHLDLHFLPHLGRNHQVQSKKQQKQQQIYINLPLPPPSHNFCQKERRGY